MHLLEEQKEKEMLGCCSRESATIQQQMVSPVRCLAGCAAVATTRAALGRGA